MLEPNGSIKAHDLTHIRARLRQELPASTFSKEPMRMLWAIPLLLTCIGGWSLILGPLDIWWSKSLVAVVIALAMGSLIFMAHEVLHGAMGGSKKIQNAVGWLGFGPILTPPDFWRGWHNRSHHAHTNHKVRDLDHFGTMARYKKVSFGNRLLKYAPGSGHPLSYLYLFYGFSLHSLIILWTVTRRHPSFKGRSWKRERMQSIALILGWVVLAVYSGSDAIYTVLIPFAGANFTIQSYIVTNHMLRPLTRENNPFRNTLSLSVPGWIDTLHFKFSHHVEHHTLPGLASNKLQHVRDWMVRECPGELALLKHPEALMWFYKTPRTYRTETELADLHSPERVFDLNLFGEYLKSDLKGRPKAHEDDFWRIRPT